MNRFIISIACLFIFFSCKNTQKENGKLSQDAANATIGCYKPSTSDKDWYSSGKKAPLFKGLKGINFKITTKSSEAQDYFNQGLMLSYGFNHAEAARSFFEATRQDSTCAMAFWGYAYVLGPNYNGGMETDNYQRAYEATQKAIALSASCTPKEKALIEALKPRYTSEPPADRKPLDIAYSAAMKKVYDQFPDDPDVGALYAESLMDLHPWDLYDKATKKPRAWTPELVRLLEQLIQKHPKHPGGHHFYVHALEASSTPEKALQSSALLDTLVPGAGHLVHMPSHIYINTGDYHLGTLSNIHAVEVDSNYTTACHAQGVYPLAYYPHNYHFLAATATLEGNTKWAWKAAKKLQANTAQEIMRMPGWGTLQHYYTIPYYIAVKLSMWDTILALPAPEKDLIYPQAIWHYARAMAYVGKQNLSEAKKELTALRVFAADSSLQKLTVWDINTTYDLVQIAEKVVRAEIAVKENQTTAANQLFREAVAIEDNLNYNEPPDWFFSVRHHWGAALLKAGNYKEAERVYREDLSKWKKNGWALLGLYQSLNFQKNTAEASKYKAAFEESWKYADISIRSSSSIEN